MEAMGRWLLEVPYDEKGYAKSFGAKWDPVKRRWFYQGGRLPKQLEPYVPPVYSWGWWLSHDLTPPAVRPEPTRIELRPHQQEAADAIVESRRRGRPGFLLADSVGLGKTYTAIAGADRLGEGLDILVLCPLSVVPHWVRSIRRLDSGRNRWCVVNYDRAKRLLEAPKFAAEAKRARTRNRRHARHGKRMVDWDVVICDESHRLKNPSTQTFSAVENLAGRGAAFRIWISATAGQNPLELAYLSPLLAQLTGCSVRDLADFEAWCQRQGIKVRRGRFGQWEWERNERDLAFMRRLLFEQEPPAGLRRRPEDLAGWPEIVRAAVPVALSRRDRELYDKAWQEFRRQVGLPGKGRDSSNPLVAALRFRQKASLVRAPYTAQLVDDLLKDGLAVAVSVEFLDTVRELVGALRSRGVDAVTITGEMAPADREAARVKFQTGEARVVVFTVTEGISLHAEDRSVDDPSSDPRALVVHDIRWSALSMSQVEGRCHRDGQSAVAYYTFAEGTVEERVVSTVLDRLNDMASMLGDDPVVLDVMTAAVR